MNKFLNPNKPGYLTSEFWAVVLSYAFSYFVQQGILTSDEAKNLAAGVAEIIVALIPLLTTLYYIYKRNELKKTAIKNPPTETMQQ